MSLTVQEKNARLKILRKYGFSAAHKDGKGYLKDKDGEIAGELNDRWEFIPEKYYDKEIPKEVQETFTAVDDVHVPDKSKAWVIDQDSNEYNLADFDDHLRKEDTRHMLDGDLAPYGYTIVMPSTGEKQPDHFDFDEILGTGAGGLFARMGNVDKQRELWRNTIGEYLIEDYLSKDTPRLNSEGELEPIKGFPYISAGNGKQRWSLQSCPANRGEVLPGPVVYHNPDKGIEAEIPEGKSPFDYFRDSGQREISQDYARNFLNEATALAYAQGIFHPTYFLDDKGNLRNAHEMDEKMRAADRNDLIKFSIGSTDKPSPDSVSSDRTYGLRLHGGKGLVEEFEPKYSQDDENRLHDYRKVLEQQYQEEIVEQREAGFNRPKNKGEYREQLAKEFERILERDGGNWQKTWVCTHRPQNGKSGRAYNGTNSFMLTIASMVNHFEDPRWVTYGEIKRNPDLTLKPGAKGYPVVYTFPVDKHGKAISWGEYHELEKKVRHGSENRLILSGYHLSNKYFNVVNAEQIDGMPKFQERNVRRTASPNAMIYDLADAMDVKLKHGGDAAFYNMENDSVTLPRPEQFRADTSYNYAALHELTHATGAPQRLNRDMSGEFGSESYAKEELIAEMGSCFEAASMGMDQVSSDCIRNSNAYIKSWLNAIHDKPEAVGHAIEEAGRAADYMDKRMDRRRQMTKQYQIITDCDRVVENYGDGRTWTTLENVSTDTGPWPAKTTAGFMSDENVKPDDLYFLFKTDKEDGLTGEIISSSNDVRALHQQRKDMFAAAEKKKEEEQKQELAKTQPEKSEEKKEPEPVRAQTQR